MPMLLQNWRRQPIFFNLERVVDKGTYNNIIIIAIVYYLIDLCDLSMVDIANNVVCFGPMV